MTTSDDRTDGYLRKVKALLERADNAGSDEEAAACRDKAFAMMAKHGIDEALARGHGTDPIEDMVFRSEGGSVYAYRDLVCFVAEALHCQAAYRVYRTTKQHVRITVYGRRSHLARLALLVPHLHVQQMHEASRATPDVEWPTHWTPQQRGAYTKNYRRSFALSWGAKVAVRLKNQEDLAGRQHGQGAALVLLSDFEKADAAMRSEMKVTEEKSQGPMDRNGLHDGDRAGARADLGNAGMTGGRVALS